MKKHEELRNRKSLALELFPVRIFLPFPSSSLSLFALILPSRLLSVSYNNSLVSYVILFSVWESREREVLVADERVGWSEYVRNKFLATVNRVYFDACLLLLTKQRSKVWNKGKGKRRKRGKKLQHQRKKFRYRLHFFIFFYSLLIPFMLLLLFIFIFVSYITVLYSCIAFPEVGIFTLYSSFFLQVWWML